MRQRFPHRPSRTTVINDRKQRRLPPKGVIPTPPEIATSTKVTNCIELSKPPITHDIINGKRTKPKLPPEKTLGKPVKSVAIIPPKRAIPHHPI